MAKLIWLSLLVIVAAVSAEEMALPMISINEEPIEKPVEQPQQPLKLGRMNEKPVEKETEKEAAEENLPPIAPIFPSFFQPDNELIDPEPLNNNNRRRGGILTILVIKSKKPDEPSDNLDETSKKIFEENLSKITQFKSQVGESFSKLASLIRNDLFGQTEQQLIGGGSEDVDRNRVVSHLLGGRDDIDSAVFRQQQQQQQQENLEEDKEQDVASSKFQSILSWFKSHQPGTLVVGDDGENDLSTVDEQQQFKMLNEQKKKCMMHSFMRLKASIYYRTIVHLLFITGIMLIIFFIAILIVRIYKRRQALRYYSANMKIATIGASFNEATEKNSKDFLFRSSSLKSSYAQAYSPSHPAPPPAYTQIAATEQVNDDDEKKSLPDYEATK
jgi:hypothetical protein